MLRKKKGSGRIYTRREKVDVNEKRQRSGRKELQTAEIQLQASNLKFP